MLTASAYTSLSSPRAHAKRRARVLIPLGDLLHPGILTSIAESKVVQILCHGRWTFNGHSCYAHAQALNQRKLETSNLLIGLGKKFVFQQETSPIHMSFCKIFFKNVFL